MDDDDKAFRKAEEEVFEMISGWRDEGRAKRITATLKQGLLQIRRTAEEQTLSSVDYKYRLNALADLLWDVDVALRITTTAESKAGKGGVWAHQRLDPVKAGDQNRGLSIDRSMLEAAAAKYLGLSACRTDFLDWLFIDALVFSEVDAYMYSVLTGSLSRVVVFTAAEGSQLKYYAYSVLASVLLFGLRFLLLPGIALWLLLHQRETAGLWVAGVFAAYLVVRLLTIPAHIGQWRLRKKHSKLMLQMHNTYHLCSPPVLNPRRLQESVSADTTGGAVYPTGALSLIDRLASVNPNTCLPFG